MKRFRGLRVERKSVSGAVWWCRVQVGFSKRTGRERGMVGAMGARWCPLNRPQAWELGRAEQEKELEARTEGPRAPKMWSISASSVVVGDVFVSGVSDVSMVV